MRKKLIVAYIECLFLLFLACAEAESPSPSSCLDGGNYTGEVVASAGIGIGSKVDIFFRPAGSSGSKEGIIGKGIIVCGMKTTEVKKGNMRITVALNKEQAGAFVLGLKKGVLRVVRSKE